MGRDHLVLLLIEDDVIVASAMRRMLRQFGQAVEIASSAAQGMARVQAMPFALVVCDMNLGDGTALDVLGMMEAGGSPPPMLLMSGFIDERMEALAAGHACIRAIVPKPIDGPTLRELVRRTLAEPAGLR
jgi:two-component system OmpR family response regulator